MYLLLYFLWLLIFHFTIFALHPGRSGFLLDPTNLYYTSGHTGGDPLTICPTPKRPPLLKYHTCDGHFSSPNSSLTKYGIRISKLSGNRLFTHTLSRLTLVLFSQIISHLYSPLLIFIYHILWGSQFHILQLLF